MFEIGRLCVKIAGRDAGKKCIIIDTIDKNNVLIDGQTRRRKCNVKHLEPLTQVLKITKKAPNTEIIRVFKTLNIDIKQTKPKKKTAKPKKTRKKKVKEVKQPLKEKKVSTTTKIETKPSKKEKETKKENKSK